MLGDEVAGWVGGSLSGRPPLVFLTVAFRSSSCKNFLVESGESLSYLSVTCSIMDVMGEAFAYQDDSPEPEPYVPTVLDAQLVPDDVAAWACSVTPGSAVIAPLLVLDPRRLSPEGRVDALAAMERQLGWWQARQHRLLAVMAEEPVMPTPLGEVAKDWVREDVACALRLSTNTASSRLAGGPGVDPAARHGGAVGAR